MSAKNYNIKILFRLSLFLYLNLLNTYCQSIDCANNCINNGFECTNKPDSICSQNCRPNYGGGENACYYCNFESIYYFINSGVCSSGCTGNFILDWSKECVLSVASSTDLYKMGAVYYRACPIYSKIKDETSDVCECENKYYKELIYGKTIYHCLPSVSECPPGKRYHNSDDKECIERCTGEYSYSANNICYKLENCNFYKEITTNDNRCLSTCDVGEGFIDLSQTQPKKCLVSCTATNSFYNHGENNCMSSCSVSNNNKIYHKPDGKECFSSCKDIDGGNLIYAQKDSSTPPTYLCYSTPPSTNCQYYFPLSNGVKKCLAAGDETECLTSNHIYLKGKECIEECDYYKAIDNSASPTSTLIKCL